MKKKKCKFCKKWFISSRKHRVYCSIKCNEKGQIIKLQQWYLGHRELTLKRGKDNPNRSLNNRRSVLKRKYGLSFGEYDQMVLKQHKLCNICKQSGKHLYVDHDHKTGKVRGLLCVKCNSALGFFNDSIRVLKAAIKHLKQ